MELAPKLLKQIYETMVRTRILEERLIRMYKQSDGYFWSGGPGEEAFNVPLGLLVHKGEGLDYDYLHLHYRSCGIVTAMGAEPIDAMRQMKNTALDPYSGGRNFSNHFAIKKWNIVPVTSTIETQYQTAIGTALAQKRHGGRGITIVNGGDAGTAEGDFASCLVWASRPQAELPILIIVTNNEWGISTAAATQRSSTHIADRGRAFGIKTELVQGNDVWESYNAIHNAMEYVRKERRPFLLEAKVSRLYGHSSATGCNFITEEVDCLAEFEKKIIGAGVISLDEATSFRQAVSDEFLRASQQVKQEALPTAETRYDDVFYGQKGRFW